ncbi:MAG: site-2 protease family protein [bacterium]|nr:site-2 protease family protein [bacterium]
METLFIIIVLIFSVVIHEVSHGFAAEAQGDPTARLAGRLTLNPLPHLDIFGSLILPGLLILSGSPFVVGWAKPVPYNPYNLRNYKWGEMLVAAAGPASNILIGLVFGLLIRFSGTIGLPDSFVEIAIYAVLINIVLAIFNMVPIPPLDGSKILFSLLPAKYLYIRENLERYGFFILIIFIVFFWRSLLPFIEICFRLFTGMSF